MAAGDDSRQQDCDTPTRPSWWLSPVSAASAAEKLARGGHLRSSSGSQIICGCTLDREATLVEVGNKTGHSTLSREKVISRSPTRNGTEGRIWPDDDRNVSRAENLDS